MLLRFRFLGALGVHDSGIRSEEEHQVEKSMEGHGDLGSRLLTPIGHVRTPTIPIIYLLT